GRLLYYHCTIPAYQGLSYDLDEIWLFFGSEISAAFISARSHEASYFDDIHALDAAYDCVPQMG
ncbi:hypothetical protein QH494_24925, partial [Sphingomonas sp. AR_OL41]|uniref:hypothetical protein n=1 Tax=Sphingomonas sp. AR_OL41 TaxID=3042729 RepID=UPI0024807A81